MEIDSGVFSDWRVMDFRRRPGPDQPDAQVIDFVDFLYQSRPVSPEDFFIPLRFDDGGNGVIASFHLPFSP
jgi:hypothetical protein